MVQVHVLSDLNNNDSYQRQPSSMFNSYRRNDQHRNYLQILFPGFKLKSFIFAISIIEIFFYILDTILLNIPNNSFVLRKYFASNGPDIARGEIWRFFTPIFVHYNFLHILLNTFVQLQIGFRYENLYGIWIFGCYYLFFAFAGNLLSVVLAPCKNAGGASTSGYGLIGLSIAETLFYWSTIEYKGPVIYNLVFFLILTLVMSLNREIDWRGHLGGFLAGFLIFIVNPVNNTRELTKTQKLIQKIGIVLLCTLIILPLIFLVIKRNSYMRCL